MADGSSMSLDDLADKSGVPARTIRFYRQTGLIDPPERIGRNAYYSLRHLERLRTIAGLRDQGMGLEAIARIIDDPSGGRQALAPLLQIGSGLQTPWSEDHEAVMSDREVLQAFGNENVALLGELERYGVIAGVPGTDPPRYAVPSVGALELAGRLHALGIADDLIYRSWLVMQEGLGALARDLITLFAEHPDQSFANWPEPRSVADTFTGLQGIALHAVQLIFANEIEAAMRAFVEGGGVIEAAERLSSLNSGSVGGASLDDASGIG